MPEKLPPWFVPKGELKPVDRGWIDKFAVDPLTNLAGDSRQGRAIAEDIVAGLEFAPFAGAATDVGYTRDLFATGHPGLGVLSGGLTLAGVLPGARALTKPGMAALRRAGAGRPAGRVSFSPEETAVAAATARGGAFAERAAVPKIAEQYINPGDRVLDFGAGKGQHANNLRSKGHDVTAYDFTPGEGIDPDALSRKYDTVYASNVLNVSSSRSMLNRTVRQIAGAMEDAGQGIVNFPTSPRKSELSAADVESVLRRRFGTVERVGGTKSAPVWRVAQPKNGDEKIAATVRRARSSRQTKR